MRQIPSVHLESPAIPGAAVQVLELDGVEAVGRPFEFQVKLVCATSDGLDPERLLTEPASLVFYSGEREVRRLFGMLSAVRDGLHSESEYLLYTVQFTPRIFRLSLTRMSSVFVDKSVPEILQFKLEQAGFQAGKDFDLRLTGNYPQRDLVVQYEETDLNFISRLAEHVGIALYFEHNDRDILVFSDHNAAFKAIDGNPTVVFYQRGEAIGVFSLQSTTRTLPGRVVLKDYNYRTPLADLVAQTAVHGAGLGSVLEYGAHFRTKAEGEEMAKIRAEELRAARCTYAGKSDVQTLRAGATFQLAGHPKHVDELLLTEVHHHATQVVFGTGQDERSTYTNDFVAIPAATTFRPARVTPKPRVHGAISGVVEAAAPGQYAELDDQGRYHVRLMLDQMGAPKGRASSLLRMAQPHAGPGYGFHFPLRDGVEVVLTCIDGDPDRPIITGAVPNTGTPSTVGSKNGMRNVIRTGGGTELNIDDNESGTRFKITTPCHNTIFQLGAPNAPVAGILMGTDKDAELRAGETMKLDAAEKIDIIAGINLNESAPWIDIGAQNKIVAHAPEVEVHGGASVTVDAPTTNIKGFDKLNAAATQVDIGGDAKILAHAPVIELAGKTKVAAAAPSIEISGKAIVTMSSQGMVIVTGAAAVNISSDAMVTVTAPMVTVAGPGMVNVTGGVIKLN